MKKDDGKEFAVQAKALNEIVTHSFEKHEWSASETLAWASVLLGSIMAETDIDGEDIVAIFEKVLCVYAAKSRVVEGNDKFCCKIDALMKHLGENS